MSYPQDSDGDALRKVAAHAHDGGVAKAVAALVMSRGYDPEISRDGESGEWSVYCSRSMLATYESVVAAQHELNALLQALGATCDGWGTFGNTRD